MYQFYLPTKIIFGTDTLDSLTLEVASMKPSSLLLVTGRKAMRENGIISKIQGIIPDSIEIILFDKVFPEPDTTLIDEGVNLAKERRCDMVIGLGGGSAIDVAKAIAGLVKEPGFISVADYLEGEGTKRISSNGVPFIAIPTTAGTGSEITMNSVIINRRTRSKRSLRSTSLFAKVAIIDPKLTVNLPAKITAYSGMDALAHLVEGYISKKSNPFTDPLALQGINLIGRSLFNAVQDGTDLQARTDMAMASLLGGICVSNAGLGIVHGIGAFLGALHNIPHGLACAVLLPYAMEFNSKVAHKKLREVNQALGMKIKDMCRKIDIPQRLSELGISKDALPELAKCGLTSSSTKGNPREVNYQDMVEFLEKAF